MFAEKAQIATEYIIITGFILVVVTIIFTYSYVTNNQSIRINQANNALDKMVNAADFIYAVGHDNNQFIDVTFPRDIKSIQDITICDDGSTTWQDHYEPPATSCNDPAYVKAGALEIQLTLIGGDSSISRAAKAEIELELYQPTEIPAEPDDKRVKATEGRHRLKVYWCEEKICFKRA